MGMGGAPAIRRRACESLSKRERNARKSEIASASGLRGRKARNDESRCDTRELMVSPPLASARACGVRLRHEPPSPEQARLWIPRSKRTCSTAFRATSPNRLFVDFEGKVHLIGYDVEPKSAAAPGSTLKLTLYWRSVRQARPRLEPVHPPARREPAESSATPTTKARCDG